MWSIGNAWVAMLSGIWMTVLRAGERVADEEEFGVGLAVEQNIPFWIEGHGIGILVEGDGLAGEAVGGGRVSFGLP